MYIYTYIYIYREREIDIDIVSVIRIDKIYIHNIDIYQRVADMILRL